MAGMQLVSIIVPTLDEVDNIDLLLKSLLALPSTDCGFEILIADGGSTDGTIDLVRKWEARAPVRLITGAGRRGLAGDVLTAAAYAAGSIVVVMDADLSHPPERIPDLVRAIVDGKSDMVVGSRYVAGGATPDWPKTRRLLSRLGGALAWPLSELRDPMSGFFAVRKERLLAIDPEASGFKIGLEIIAEGGGRLRVSEVPIVFHDRVRGTSKIGWTQMLSFARRLMVLAGGAVSLGNATRFAGVGLMGLAVDLLIFQILFGLGIALVTAHAVSFAVATVFNYTLNSRWAFATRSANVRQSDGIRILRFITVCLLAFALRGGVLAGAVDLFGWPPQFAIVLGVGAATVVNYLGNAFFVFPSVSPRVPLDIRWRIAAIGVLGYVLLLRMVYLGLVDLLPEEAYYWNYAQHLDIGYLDHPPMVAWLIWLGTEVFGNTELGVRIGAYASWIAGAAFIFQFSRNLVGKSAAFVSVVLVAALPYFFSNGFIMMPDAPLTAAWAGSLYFLERALLGNRRRAWLGAGLMIGFGLLSKYTIVLLGLATLTFVLLDPKSRRWLLRPEPYLAAIVACVLFSPVIFWNATHDWVSFLFQSSRRLEDNFEFSLPTLVADALVLLTPLGLIAAVSALVGIVRHSFPDKSDLGDSRQARFVAIYTLVPLSVFVAFSLFHNVKLNWSGPTWLALLPVISNALITGSHIGGTLRRWWVPNVMGVLVFYGLGFHYLVLGLPTVGYVGNIRTLPVAWQEFGRDAGQIQVAVEEETGKPVLLITIGKYFAASELAFYNRARQHASTSSVGGAALGQDSLMYNYWYRPEDMRGRTAVLYALKRRDLEKDSLNAHFSRLTDIQERKITKHGIAAGSYFYRVGYDLRP